MKRVKKASCVLIALVMALVGVGVLPVTVYAGEGARRMSTVSSNFDYTTAITDDGILLRWNRWADAEPTQLLRNVVHVASSTNNSMALTADGVLWGWGDGINLGIGSYFEWVEDPVRIMDNVAYFSLGHRNAMVITNDNVLWGWGNNYDGLGNGTREYSYYPVRIMDNVTYVSADTSGHIMAITTDGTLWGWGSNWWGEIGNGTTTAQLSPVRIMDNVVFVSPSTHSHTMAITADGTLWGWGANYSGQIGDGTSIDRDRPVEIMGNVAYVYASGAGYTMALTIDGVVWGWGFNGGRLGDGTDDNRLSPVRIMDNVAFLSSDFAHSLAITTDGVLYGWGDYRYFPGIRPTRLMENIAYASAAHVMFWTSSYIVSKAITTDGVLHVMSAGPDWEMPNIRIPGASTFQAAQLEISPTETMPAVTSQEPIVPFTGFEQLSPAALNQVVDQASAVAAVRDALAVADEDSVIERGLLELFADNAIARAASMEVNGNNVIVSQATLGTLEQTAVDTRAAIEAMFQQEGYMARRSLNTNASFVVSGSAQTSGQITVQIDPSATESAVEQVRIRTTYYELNLPPNFIADNADTPLTITVSMGNSYNIAFSHEIEGSVRLAVAPLPGSDTAYQTMRNAGGQIVTSRYNPVTDSIEGRITFSGTFTVVENRVDFGDIQHLSQGMQQAIRELAAQGVITGTGADRFSPDDSVNRAQMSTLIMRMIGGLDPNADGGFNDVQRADWFFGAAGSANRRGIMTGTGGGNFSPLLVLPREQLTVIITRVLRSEMGYQIPADPARYVQVFTDRAALSGWAVDDIALATRENIVIHRADGQFRPGDSMNRGDVALMMHRLYLLLW